MTNLLRPLRAALVSLSLAFTAACGAAGGEEAVGSSPEAAHEDSSGGAPAREEAPAATTPPAVTTPPAPSSHPIALGAGNRAPFIDRTKTPSQPRPEAASLKAEAGFIEVPASETKLGPTYEARMFYSFHPAEQNADSAPLLVFFNGGPGAATSSILLPFGTGPATLDPRAVGDATPVDNPDSYTRFANLLYIDERQTGFSYGVDRPDGKTCRVSTQGGMYLEDASDFIRVMLDFLDGHETLRDNPVVLVGESYGGIRATSMLYMLQHHADSEPLPGVANITLSARAPFLAERVSRHFALAFPETAGKQLGPDDVARQFGHQVLIQPAVGSYHMLAQESVNNMTSDPLFGEYVADPTRFDPYDVRLTRAQAEDRGRRVAVAMQTPSHLEKLLGVKLGDIAHLKAGERGAAFRTKMAERLEDAAGSVHWRAELGDGSVVRTDASEGPRQAGAGLNEALGELAEGDRYWMPLAGDCRPQGDMTELAMFADTLTHTRTFITNARYDAVIHSTTLRLVLQKMLSSAWTITHDEATPSNSARPGELRFESVGQQPSLTVRYPRYEAGHEVTVSAGKELGHDIEAWLADGGAK